MIKENLSFGNHTVAHLLEMNKKTFRRVLHIMGRVVGKRPVGFRHRIQAKPSVATAPTTAGTDCSIRSFRPCRDPVQLRSDNRLVFHRRSSTVLVKSYGCSSSSSCSTARNRKAWLGGISYPSMIMRSSPPIRYYSARQLRDCRLDRLL